MNQRDDVEVKPDAKASIGSAGRNVIAVIGIDRYQHWPRLSNAVRDATGAAALFRRLGFEEIAPLLGDRATGAAIESLVTDDLMALGPDDSLVLFYAGHGGTRSHRLGNEVIKTGYLIPVDASDSPDKVSTWIDLEGWLRAVSLLPAKHILVLLDACHSGVALDPIIKWRDIGSWQDAPLATLQARRSRRIITSALDDQVALDSGPVHGHSLFTGCLLEGLTGGIRGDRGTVTTGSELGLYVQQRVQTYPGARQTPDFGTFAFDDRGEMLIPLAIDSTRPDGMPECAPEELVPESVPIPPAAGATSSAPSQTPAPPSKNVASVASAPEPTEPASTEATPRRTPILSSGRGRDRAPRWITFVVMVAVCAIAVVAYRDSSDSSEHPMIVPPGVATRESPDAQAALDGSPSSRLADPPPKGCQPGMVPVPAGTFRMGSPDGAGELNEHPQHEVTLSAYCIDKTEVTVKAYAACVATGGCTPVKYSRGCNRDDRPDHPINCVDWNQAAAYCAWADKRLPTEAEWEYAARGTDGRMYPWGNEAPSARRLNACGIECAEMGKRDRNQHWTKMYNASDGWPTTASVGRFPEGASPFGVLDMAGNVWEWTADLYDSYSASAVTDPRGPKVGHGRVLRGGGWRRWDAGNIFTALRRGSSASGRNVYTGFRCARGD